MKSINKIRGTLFPLIIGTCALVILSGCSQRISNNQTFNSSYFLAQSVAIIPINEGGENEKWNARNYMTFLLLNPRMNFVDLATLEKNQIDDAVYKNCKLMAANIVFENSKTGMLIISPLDKAAIEILNMYNITEKGEAESVFPIAFENTKKGIQNFNKSSKVYLKAFKELALEANWIPRFTCEPVRNNWSIVIDRSDEEILSDN
ncbi:MAG: hypothetical protein HRT71_19180 [Flavobacteriales bacterium]|nr:hypothetical protein [Flavobacteriales bacterium]